MSNILYRLVNVPKGVISGLDPSNLTVIGEASTQYQYIAKMTQSGTTAPQLSVLKNDSNDSYAFQYDNQGQYSLSLSSGVGNQIEKFNIFIGASPATNILIQSRLYHDNLLNQTILEINTYSRTTGNLINDALNGTPIMITKFI